MTKTNLFAASGGGDHITDLHLLVRHHDSINEQLYQLPFLLKGGLLETTTYSLTKLKNRTGYPNYFHLLLDAGFDLTSLVV